MNSPGPLNPDAPGTLLLRDNGTCQWLLFEQPREVVSATLPEDVVPLIENLDAMVKRGLYAAGFISYEAASAFDPAFRTHAPNPAIPLMWFGFYEAPRTIDFPDIPESMQGAVVDSSWDPDISSGEYRAAIAKIRDYIAAGDTYQVNYTFRLHKRLREDPWRLFVRLQHAQRAQYGAYVNTGKVVFCSASPELFFSLNGTKIVCSPMKGTAPRQSRAEEDAAQGEALQKSEKDRAENIMIVDMMRNDLGRIARPGTVEVVSLFNVQRYPTVWQMTSTIRAETKAGLPDIFRALFPCASITGAPKVRTMEIIAETEKKPRGIYTGCIGFVSPSQRAQFNVAIRTVQIVPGMPVAPVGTDTKWAEYGAPVGTAPVGAPVGTDTKWAEYGVGGGVVWDSLPESEYAECLIKSAVLKEMPTSFKLLETMLWQPGKGYLFEERHLQRLFNSAQYFSFAVDVAAVRMLLVKTAAGFTDFPMRIRLLVSENGELTIETSPAQSDFSRNHLQQQTEPWLVAVASQPVSCGNRFLYHKTTRREVYESARSTCPEVDDVILRNEYGHITEATIANVVVDLKGELCTPPISCGLLDGVFRQHLLAEGTIRERILYESDLVRANKLYLINSVRGWISCRI